MPAKIRLVLVALLLPALPALAARDQPFPLKVAVGGVIKLCRTGTIQCPATGPICDDPSIATMRGGEEGLELVGVKVGTTLCSAAAANMQRRVYAVTVVTAR